MRVFILPGRHQPPHNDHLALIRRTLERIDGELYLALLLADPAYAPELEDASEHHEKCRNPYSFDERRRMLRAALDEENIGARVHLLALPRPELAWALVTAIFPEERTWIVPDVGENFDDRKSEYFRARGDRVLRILAQVTTNGRQVRELAAKRSPELARHVPRAVYELITIKKEPS
jgi:nicotinamide mononucleotide adenylyltransferase